MLVVDCKFWWPSLLSCNCLQAPKKKLSNKEKKQRAKVRKAQRERGEDVSDTDEDDL